MMAQNAPSQSPPAIMNTCEAQGQKRSDSHVTMSCIGICLRHGVAVFLATSSVACSFDNPRQDLDAAVRGRLPQQAWHALDDSFKYRQCLRYKISLMRELVSEVDGPVGLIDYYPGWTKSLEECELAYRIERDKAERLRGSAVTEMAKVLGEETTSYLIESRLFENKDDPSREWLDIWRSVAIGGIASVADALPELERESLSDDDLERIANEYATIHNATMELLRPLRQAETLPVEQEFEYIDSHSSELMAVNAQLHTLAARARIIADSLRAYSTPAAAELMTIQAEYLDLVQRRNDAVLRTARLALACDDNRELCSSVIQAAESLLVLNTQLAELQARMEAHYRERVLR